MLTFKEGTRPRAPRLQGRDVFNEKPTEEEALADPAAAARAALPAAATLHTSLGDITARLHGEAAPKTVENFTTHARNGYYDGVLFHRVIKDFMLQTGARRGAPELSRCIVQPHVLVLDAVGRKYVRAGGVTHAVGGSC